MNDMELRVTSELGYFEANTYDDSTPADVQVGYLRAIVLDMAREIDRLSTILGQSEWQRLGAVNVDREVLTRSKP